MRTVTEFNNSPIIAVTKISVSYKFLRGVLLRMHVFYLALLALANW